MASHRSTCLGNQRDAEITNIKSKLEQALQLLDNTVEDNPINGHLLSTNIKNLDKTLAQYEASLYQRVTRADPNVTEIIKIWTAIREKYFTKRDAIKQWMYSKETLLTNQLYRFCPLTWSSSRNQHHLDASVHQVEAHAPKAFSLRCSGNKKVPWWTRNPPTPTQRPPRESKFRTMPAAAKALCQSRTLYHNKNTAFQMVLSPHRDHGHQLLRSFPAAPAHPAKDPRSSPSMALSTISLPHQRKFRST